MSDLVETLRAEGHADLAGALELRQREAAEAGEPAQPAAPDPNEQLLANMKAKLDEGCSSSPLFPNANEVDPVVAALDRDVPNWGR